MGNNRFKFSDMIPNAWFYKLRDMSRSKKRNGSHVMKNNKKVTSPPTSSSSSSQRSQQRNSHYFSIEPNRTGKSYNSPIYTKHSNITFTDYSPRRSSKRRAKRKTIYKPSPNVVSSPILEPYICHSTNNFTKKNQNQYSPNSYVSSLESSSESECDKFTSECSCRVSSSTNDIIIDMKNESFNRNPENLDGFDTISQLGLAPILTKPVKFDDKVNEVNNELKKSTKSNEINGKKSLSIKISREERNGTKRERKTSPLARISSSNSTGVRLRVNSPKLGSRKVQGYAARRSVSTSAGFPEGFAVVKSSIDPQRDFKESMVEMIMENNIRESKDLENLLACYLSLNSCEYHDLIVKAFEQIWYDLAQLKL